MTNQPPVNPNQPQGFPPRPQFGQIPQPPAVAQPLRHVPHKEP
jgi:hypothetical protein